MNPMRTLKATVLPALLLTTTLGVGNVAFAEAPVESSADVDREAAWQRFLEQEDVGEGQSTTKKSDSDVLTSGVSNSTLGGLLAVMFGGFGVLTLMGARGKMPELASLIGKKIGNPDTSLDDVQVVAIRSLGNNNALAVVEVFEQRLVLGVSQGQVSLLTRIGEGGTISETSIDHNTPNDFGTVLGSMIEPSAQAPGYDAQAVRNAWNERSAATPTVPEAPAEALNPGPKNLANQAMEADTFVPMTTPETELNNGQSLDEVLQAVLKARRAKGARGPETKAEAKPQGTQQATASGYSPRGIPTTPRDAKPREERRPVATATRDPIPKAPQAKPTTPPLSRPTRPAWSQGDVARSRTPSERGAADQVIRRLQTMRRFR